MCPFDGDCDCEICAQRLTDHCEACWAAHDKVVMEAMMADPGLREDGE